MVKRCELSVTQPGEVVSLQLFCFHHEILDLGSQVERVPGPVDMDLILSVSKRLHREGLLVTETVSLALYPNFFRKRAVSL